ncbi:hypothetical protein [Hymenobacter chitinivorans]|uniref:Uncharacterized protein n=1 Tax=Hymenobacter chitinivorans DSM 11115 TaxID=1121954 RepID=A0A2M9BA33_9BACT|nr:hypothetical protein [Hymenobacter chitinivorans]PJJ54797.1 hypothetical protein CLV45_3143 [Hymenobacter chitinivorans DSM 11115]
MYKITCLLGLLLTSSLAFAQNQPAVPATARYLMLVRGIDTYESVNGHISLTVIQPDGTIRTEELQKFEANTVGKKAANASISRFAPDSTSSYTRRQRYAQNTVYQAEVKKLNELSAQGWQLVSTTQEGPTVRYLFRQGLVAGQ